MSHVSNREQEGITIGLQYDLLRGESLDMTTQWSLVLDLHYGCTDYACNQTETFKGLTFTYKH